MPNSQYAHADLLTTTAITWHLAFTDALLHGKSLLYRVLNTRCHALRMVVVAATLRRQVVWQLRRPLDCLQRTSL